MVGRSVVVAGQEFCTRPAVVVTRSVEAPSVEGLVSHLDLATQSAAEIAGIAAVLPRLSDRDHDRGPRCVVIHQVSIGRGTTASALIGMIVMSPVMLDPGRQARPLRGKVGRTSQGSPNQLKHGSTPDTSGCSRRSDARHSFAVILR